MQEIKANEKGNYRLLKYIISGLAAASVHLTALWLGVSILNLPELPSSIIGYCAAIGVNYGLQHRFVFRVIGNHQIFFRRYVLVTLFAQLINASLFWWLSSAMGVQYLIAQILTIGVLFLCNYFLNSRFTFRSPNRSHVSVDQGE